MAQITPSYLAGGTIRPSRFVRLSDTEDFTVLEADANSKIIGISQEGGRTAPIPAVSTVNAAEDGDTLNVYGPTMDCLLELGGTVASGDDLKSDADGQGVVLTQGATNQEVGATALEGGISGDLIRVIVAPRSEGGTAEFS